MPIGIPSTTVEWLAQNNLGYFTSCIAPTAGQTLPTTASTFATGCIIQNTGDGTTWINIGTVAVPVWESDLISINVPMTAAQIISNYTTSLEAIPAFPGRAIILDSAVFDLTGTATQFTGGGVVNLQYKNTANGAGTTLHADIAATVVTGATARVLTVRPASVQSAIATADIVGVGVFIGTKTAVFAAGTGTAVWRIKYHLV